MKPGALGKSTVLLINHADKTFIQSNYKLSIFPKAFQSSSYFGLSGTMEIHSSGLQEFPPVVLEPLPIHLSPYQSTDIALCT